MFWNALWNVQTSREHFITRRRQRSLVLKGPDLKSGGNWLKSSSLPLDGFVFGIPRLHASTLCKLPTGLLPVEIFNNFCLIYNICTVVLNTLTQYNLVYINSSCKIRGENRVNYGQLENRERSRFGRHRIFLLQPRHARHVTRDTVSLVAWKIKPNLPERFTFQ